MPLLILKYNKIYIGLTKDGSVKNFVKFKPKKNYVYLCLKGNESQEIKEKFENAGLEISYEETEEDVSERIVTEQVPVSRIEIYEGTNVVIEYGEK
mgnify:CR=1 FL=1